MIFFVAHARIFDFLTVAYRLNQLGLDNNMWSLFVTEMHTNPRRLNCANCDTQTTVPVLRNHAIRKNNYRMVVINLYCLFHGQIDCRLLYFLRILCCKFGCCYFNNFFFRVNYTNVLDVPVTQ